MEVLSRMEKHKSQKKRKPDILYWLISFLLYVLILYAFNRYVSLPTSLSFLQTMELSLFFCAVLFIDLYLLAFTYLSTKSMMMVSTDERIMKAKLYIVGLWLIALFYHFTLWLLSTSILNTLYYRIGVAITLGAMVFMFGHFWTYFSNVHDYHKAKNKSKRFENRRYAYELLKGIHYMYHIIQDVMVKDPEIWHMMRGNEFDVMLDNMIGEAQPYVQASSFVKEDMDKLQAVKLWMENMMLIIEQHPKHKDILNQVMK